MVDRCHALRQGRTNARFLAQVQGRLKKVLIHGPLQRVRSAPQASHLTRRCQVLLAGSGVGTVSLIFFFAFSYNSMVNYTRI